MGHGLADRDGFHPRRRELRAAQNEADLRTIAVRDDQPIALLDQVDERGDGTADRLVLIGDGIVVGVDDERVTTERDDGSLAHGLPGPLSEVPGMDSSELDRAAM